MRYFACALMVLVGVSLFDHVAVLAAPGDLIGAAQAQSVPAAPNNEVPAAPSSAGQLREGAAIPTGREDIPVGYITFKTPFEQWLILMTVATLAVTIAALTAMGWRTGLTPDFVRAFIVVIVVFSALFLIAAGYSDKQAAPVYALLGTIVGYIFGRMTNEREPQPTGDTGGSAQKPDSPRPGTTDHAKGRDSDVPKPSGQTDIAAADGTSGLRPAEVKL